MDGAIISPSLLFELREAVTSETRAGSTSSGGQAIPIGAGALSLAQDIDNEARDHLWDWRHRLLVGRTEDVIEALGHMGDDDYFEHITQDWIERIQAIIAPKKPPRRIHLPCPRCGVLYGGPMRKPGLQVHCWASDETMAPPNQWSAECIHCSAAWAAGELAWLIGHTAISANGLENI